MAKVSDPHLVLIIEEDVLKLQVQVMNLFAVKVLKALDKLSEVGSDELIIQMFLSLDCKVKEVSKAYCIMMQETSVF